MKLPHKARAVDLYISPLFRKNLGFAHRLHPDAIYILSAKYGLLKLQEEVEPYNQTLNTMSTDEIRRWANGVLKQLAECADLKQDQFTFLAGEKYRKFLIPQISHVHVPMEGLPIGKQLQYLSRGRNE
ncbi:MAG: hypothetical protein U0175_20575 [Caldilineaceae bacterium]